MRVPGRSILAFCLAAACCGFLVMPALSEEGYSLERLRSAKATFEQECKQCHTIKYALNETKSRDDWTLTVNMMVSNGADLSADQKGLIVDYLTAKSLFETRCSACHPIDRPLSKSKTPEQWRTTVERMGAKRPGHLSESDVNAISSYLALERPAP